MRVRASAARSGAKVQKRERGRESVDCDVTSVSSVAPSLPPLGFISVHFCSIFSGSIITTKVQLRGGGAEGSLCVRASDARCRTMDNLSHDDYVFAA